MALETERKYLNADLATVRLKLQELGAKSCGLHLEENIIYDTDELMLYKSDRVLRLRVCYWPDKRKSFLTLKMPALASANLMKVREEYEAEVDQLEIIKNIFTGLGYQPCARYEKTRESWLLNLPGRETARIDLDALSFCNVVEIEGSEKDIDEAAKVLGLDKLQISTKSYHKLNMEWREKNGLAPDNNFVFGLAEKKRIIAELGLSKVK